MKVKICAVDCFNHSTGKKSEWFYAAFINRNKVLFETKIYRSQKLLLKNTKRLFGNNITIINPFSYLL